MTLQNLYFSKTIKNYALKLAGDKETAEDLISQAFEIMLTKDDSLHTAGFYCRIMRNQHLKSTNRLAPKFDHESDTNQDVEDTLDKMSHYHSNILRAVAGGDKLTTIHKGANIGYRTLKGDFSKAKKEFKTMYENKTKIAIIVRGISGVSYHRLIMPLAKMKRDYGIDVVCLDNKNDEWFEKLDGVTHVIYNRNISDKMQPEEAYMKLKAKDIKVICDVDDYWVLPKGHPMKYYYGKTHLDKCIVKNLRLADVVWTTTKLLAEKIAPYNKNIVIVKNALDPLEKQFAYESLSIQFDTFFYSGGSTHIKDLKMMGNAFENETLLIKAPAVPKRMQAIKKQLSNVQSYATDYEHCGICVIPLQDNVFNSCKSELKLIEAGHFAKPVLVSAVNPYKSLSTVKNTIKVHNNRWNDAIKTIKGNHMMQVELGLKLQEDVRAKHNLDKENSKRLQSL